MDSDSSFGGACCAAFVSEPDRFCEKAEKPSNPRAFIGSPESSDRHRVRILAATHLSCRAYTEDAERGNIVGGTKGTYRTARHQVDWRLHRLFLLAFFRTIFAVRISCVDASEQGQKNTAEQKRRTVCSTPHCIATVSLFISSEKLADCEISSFSRIHRTGSSRPSFDDTVLPNKLDKL